MLIILFGMAQNDHKLLDTCWYSYMFWQWLIYFCIALCHLSPQLNSLIPFGRLGAPDTVDWARTHADSQRWCLYAGDWWVPSLVMMQFSSWNVLFFVDLWSLLKDLEFNETLWRIIYIYIIAHRLRMMLWNMVLELRICHRLLRITMAVNKDRIGSSSL